MHKILFRVAFVCLIAFSFYIMYVELVVNKNFTIKTNPDGPDLTDYFTTN